MVSNDAALRIKAAHLGVGAAEHQPTQRAWADRPVGWSVIECAHELVDCLYAAGAVEASAVAEAAPMTENEFAVLRSGSQSALTRLRGDELVTDDLGRYRFVVPETSIRVQSVHKTDGTNDLTAKIRAKYVYSKETEILLTYVSGEDLVPPDLTDLDADIEPVLPLQIQDAVSYRLASLIAFRVTQNVDLQQSLEGRYYHALSLAKAADMRPEGGETFWGNLSANAALEELDY